MTRAAATLVVRSTLSALFVVGYFVIVAVFMRMDAPLDPEKREILMLLLGILSNGVILVLQFWLGSSQGSADKSASRGETT